MLSIKLFFTSDSAYSSTLLITGILLLSPTSEALSTLNSDLPETTNPALHQQLQISIKNTMAIACNPYHRVASWVAFHLSHQDLEMKPRQKRITNNYPADPFMDGDCSVNDREYKEYTAKGYDRGHLADAESFSGTPDGNREVAHTSNLAPQDLSFNRGIWAKLEGWQRSQAMIEKDIFVYVGPVLHDKLPHLKAGISIPEQYYKIIIDLTPPRKAIAFIIDQNDRGSFKKHWVCPEQVETATGLKFAEKMLGPEKETLFRNCHFSEWQ